MSELLISDLKFLENNPRKHGEKNLSMIETSLRELGAARSIVIDENDVILAGNGTVTSAPGAGISRVRVVEAEGDELIAVRRRNLTDEQKKLLAVRDNSSSDSSEWEADVVRRLVAEGMPQEAFGDDDRVLEILCASEDEQRSAEGHVAEEARQTLAERFGVPPFSVLDARQGYWQMRKNAWLGLGLRSFEGRGENLTFDNAGAKPPAFYNLRNEMRAQTGVDPSWDEVNAEATRRGMMSAAVEGTSIFDPVLCELCYRWFCPPGGLIFDPFAGGSVRGLVAAKLGRSYVGVDLRAEQVETNRAAWQQFVSHCEAETAAPVWIDGDSAHLSQIQNVPDEEGVDFLFSCPPYADLEVYSDDPRDLSNMSYRDFLGAYEAAILQSVARLKEDRFACFVVGDVRNSRGHYRGFVADTIRAFEDAGARFYNDAVLLTMDSSAAVRAGRAFENSRKLCKTHQNVLVFVKGDAKKATEAVGICDFGEQNDPAEQFGEVVP